MKKTILLGVALSTLTLTVAAHDDACKNGKVMITKGSLGFINYEQFDDFNNRVIYDYSNTRDSDLKKGIEAGYIQKFKNPTQACIDSYAANRGRYSVIPMGENIGKVWIDKESIVHYK